MLLTATIALIASLTGDAPALANRGGRRGPTASGVVGAVDAGNAAVSANRGLPDCVGNVRVPRVTDPVPSACENFWSYACTSSAREPAPEGEGSPALEIYNTELEAALTEGGFYADFQARITANGDPLFRTSRDETVANYTALYDRDGAQGLLDHLSRFFNATPIITPAWIGIGGFVDKYATIRMERSPEVGFLSYSPTGEAFTDAAVMRARGAFLRDMFATLQPAEFRDMAIEYVSLIHRGARSQWENRLDDEPAFRTRVANRIFPAAERTRLQGYFDSVRAIGGGILTESGGVDPADTGGLAAVDLVWPEETTEWLRDITVSRNARYHRDRNDILIQGGYRGGNEFDVLRTMAHEYGHAIDANVRTGPSRERMNRVKTCLERADGAGARPDQTGEGLGDWYYAEILSRHMESKAPAMTLSQKRTAAINSVLSCDPLSSYTGRGLLGGEDPHQRWDVRANRILMAHPYFRGLFGCSATENPRYCDGAAEGGTP